MARTSKITGVTLYPPQILYLNALAEKGYNKSFIIREALELHQKHYQPSEIEREEGLNDE